MCYSTNRRCLCSQSESHSPYFKEWQHRTCDVHTDVVPTCMHVYVRCVYLAIKLNEGEMPIQNRTCVEWERQKYQAILYSKRTGFKYAALATMAAMLQMLRQANTVNTQTNCNIRGKVFKIVVYFKLKWRQTATHTLCTAEFCIYKFAFSFCSCCCCILLFSFYFIYFFTYIETILHYRFQIEYQRQFILNTSSDHKCKTQSTI